jgi:hypothetical protein
MSKSAPFGKRRLSSLAEHPERHYAAAAEAAPSRRAVKGIEPIATDTRFADALSLLHWLEDAHRRLKHRAAVLRAERWLERRPRDKRAMSGLEQLKRNCPVPAEQLAPPDDSVKELSAEVASALGAEASRRLNREVMAEQCDEIDHAVRVRIFAQKELVEQVRHELSVEQAQRVKPQQRAAVLAIFRAAQALAAAVDSEEALRATVLENGFLWLPELLPSPKLHSALVLGSETDPGSEISRVRRLLEDLKVLQ